MANPFIDTDIIIRLLTNDDPHKQAAAADLFKKIEKGQLSVSAPDTVIADCVYVLSSPRLYNLSRVKIRDLLDTILNLSHFKVQNKRIMLKALKLYANSNLDFSDTFIIASMEQSKSKVLYSYDRDFDHIPTITRQEP